MKSHPELIYLASRRCGISVPNLIYDAFCYNEIHITGQCICWLQARLLKYNLAPQLVEDYALQLLSQKERYETCAKFLAEAAPSHSLWLALSDAQKAASAPHAAS